MSWFSKRIKEPSSHAGVAALVGVGASVISGQMDWRVGLGSALFAALSIFLPEVGAALPVYDPRKPGGGR